MELIKHIFGLSLVLALQNFLLCSGDPSQDCNMTLPLHDAVEHGLPEEIDLAVQNGVDLYALDCNGLSAMHLAIKENKPEAIYELVSNDFDLNFPFANGEAVLFYALRFPSGGIVELLLSLGAEVNVFNDQGITPLLSVMLADDSQFTELLKKHGATLDVKLPGGDTPLHRAAEAGNLRAVSKIIEVIKYETVDVRNDKKETPLLRALRKNRSAVINFLVAKGAKLDRQTNHKETYVYFGVKYNSLNSLRTLLELDSSPGSCDLPWKVFPLNKAVLDNKAAAAGLLARFRVHKQCSWKETYPSPLNTFHLAAFAGCADSIPWLIDLGFDIDYQNGDGNTALHIAANEGNLKAAEVLIKSGACLTYKNIYGNTPRDLAKSEEIKALFDKVK